MTTIAFTGGGSGGHIYPGLAVAERLSQRLDCRLVWLGSRSALDRSIVEKAGLEFIALPAGKLRRYFSFKNITDIVQIIAGFFTARKHLKRLRPSLLFSRGGFVSVPPCLAARSLGIPVYIHESDFSPGLATRLTLGSARLIFVAYDETVGMFSERVRSRVRVVGNPLRSAFADADEERGRRYLGVDRSVRILLVLGGSQGARQVNELIAACLPELEKLYLVVHQTGSDGVSAAVSDRYRPFSYIRDELPDVLAAAELVVGRSGAGTVWETAALGKPMILIPLAGAARGDQVENAAYFQRRGAAISLVGADAVPERVLASVQRLHEDTVLRLSMAVAAAAATRLSAADDIASLIIHDETEDAE